MGLLAASPLDASGTPPPSCDNQKYVPTLPMSWGAKPPPVRTSAEGVLGALSPPNQKGKDLLRATGTSQLPGPGAVTWGI